MYVCMYVCLNGSVHQIRLRSSVFLLWNARPGRPHFVLVEPLTANLLNFCLISLRKRHFSLWGKLSFLSWKPSLACRIQSDLSCVSNFLILFNTLFHLACRVLAPDEFRDVPRNLNQLLSYTLQWVQSEVVQHQLNVTPMRPPKRNKLTFTVVVRSILKFRGSIKIDISKTTGQISFLNSKPIFVVSNNQLVSIYRSNTIFCGQFRNWDWPFHATSFPKKNYTKEAVKKRWLPRYRENQNKITRAMPNGQYWVFKALFVPLTISQSCALPE